MRGLVLVFLILPALARGAVSLPLGPHYRAGKYLPVLTTAPATLAVPGCTTTVTTTGPQFSPVFCRDDGITQLTATDGGGGPPVTFPLAPLADTDLLVLTDTTPPDLSGAFPGRHVVLVTLTPWELARCAHAADAVYTDRPGEAPGDAFLAGTTMVTAAVPPPPPSSSIPWQKRGPLYVATPPPPPATVDPLAYSAAPWPGGATGATRHDLPLYATLFAVTALAVSLVEGRLAVPGLVVVCLATAVVLTLVESAAPPARVLARVTPRGGVREELLTVTPRPRHSATLPWGPATWPLTPGPDRPLLLRDQTFVIPAPAAFIRRTW